MKQSYLLLVIVLCGSVYGQNAVTEWAEIVQPAIHSASAPRAVPNAVILHTIIQLAIYDAVVSVQGGFKPFAGSMSAQPGADVRAAVATAAWRAARERVSPAQSAYLDAAYENYTVSIAPGPARQSGVEAGEAAAAAVLAARASDGINNVTIYACSSTPPPAGEFEPDNGCGNQPVGGNVGEIKPFTFDDRSRFRPDGPDPLTSNAYTQDFMETRDYGASNSSLRTPEQTDIAYFWAEHGYVHVNRNLIRLANSRGLDIRNTARLLATVYTAMADAMIAGFEAKYFYRSWRPRTAIPRADTDENPDTDADPTWTPLLSVNHPEYPSAHGFASTAMTDAVARFFGTNKVTWAIVTSNAAIPQLVTTERTYYDMNSLMREIDDARVWAGLHWRHSMRHGDQIGRKVAKHVCDNFFVPVP
jgi:hypothetical protein